MSDPSTIRKIIHIDMDAFYASVEQRDNPDLKGKPVAVGGSKSRGVVAAASYEARRFGVFSAMASSIAYRKCPSIIFVKPRFDHYKAVSDEIRAIFHEYTDLVEPLSLDEAYLDVTNNKKGLPSATLIAQEIRKKVFERTQLTCSAGISINKFLAKTASDINKPNGQKLIKPEEIDTFINQLKVKDFFGVGKVTTEKMKRMGIHKGADLKSKTLPFLIKNFGKSGQYFFNICRGEDHRVVNPNRIRKSVSVENTYSNDLIQLEDIQEELGKLSMNLAERIKNTSLAGKTIILKIKYDDFEQVTRSKTASIWLNSHIQFEPIWNDFFKELDIFEQPIRLLGLGLSNLNTSDKLDHGWQLTLEY